jgi:hypothetical protein
MKVGERYNPKGLFYGALIPNWLLKRTELNLCAKVVWGRLYQYCNDEGRAFPKLETLAEELGCSLSGVKKAIYELEAAGLLTVEDHFAEHQGSDYFFVWHEWIEEGARIRTPAPKDGAKYRTVPRQTQSSSRAKDSASHKRAGAPATKELAGELQSSSLKGRESEEESQGKESGWPVASRPAGSPLTSTISPHLEANEVDEREPCAPAPIPHVGEEDPAAAAVRRALEAQERRKKATLILADASQKTEEALARKKAKRHKPKLWQPPPNEVEELPPELAAEPTKGRFMRVWRAEMQKQFPNMPLAAVWGQREYGQTQSLLDRYEADRVEDSFRYVIRNWDKLRERLFKGSGSPVPSVGVLVALHASLIPEAAVWAKHRVVLEEYAAFGSDYQERPDDLVARYVEAQKDLKALGL